MPIIKLPHGTVHYSEQGVGTPLLLLHANPGDSRDFDAITPTLSDNFRVIRLDWPGYGQSPAPSDPQHVSAMFFYEVLKDFIAALMLPPTILIGNSVGGYAAARLAIEAPDRVLALVLVSPGSFTPQNWLTRTFCALQASRFSIPPAWFAGLYLHARNANTTSILERARNEQSHPIAHQINRAVWRSFGDPAHNLIQHAVGITQPTLLVFGKHDPVIKASSDGKIAAGSIRHATLAILPTGHLSFAESPDAFMARLLPFLQANAPTKGHSPA